MPENIPTLKPENLAYTALKQMSPRLFGVLMNIEPAIAALIGFLVLENSWGCSR